MADEGTNVPLAETRPVPAVTDEGSGAHEPVRRVGECPTRVVPREEHAGEARRPAVKPPEARSSHVSRLTTPGSGHRLVDGMSGDAVQAATGVAQGHPVRRTADLG